MVKNLFERFFNYFWEMKHDEKTNEVKVSNKQYIGFFILGCMIWFVACLIFVVPIFAITFYAQEVREGVVIGKIYQPKETVFRTEYSEVGIIKGKSQIYQKLDEQWMLMLQVTKGYKNLIGKQYQIKVDKNLYKQVTQGSKCFIVNYVEEKIWSCEITKP